MNRLDLPPAYVALCAAALDDARARGGEPDWLTALREASAERLREIGLPTIRTEDWRYTNVRPLAEAQFALPRLSPAPDITHLLPRRMGDECELIFVDGRLAPEHSRFEDVEGLVVEPLEVSVRNGSGARLRDHLSAVPVTEQGPFTLMNQALCTGGIYLRVRRNVVLNRRVHVLFLTTGLQPRLLTAPRVVVALEDGAQARIVQSHIGHPGAVSFTNVVTDIQVGRQAQLLFAKVQAEANDAFHYGALRTQQAADSQATLFDFTVGSKWARHDLEARLDGPGAEVHLNGLTALKGRQHVDHHTTVDHRVPHGTSRQLYKSILDGQARLVFNGRVCVQPGAMATDGYQLNRNLLLSRQAVVNTKPQLEIANADVKCTHGATIGQLDDNQLFYLQSRGISPVDAAAILARGFVEEVLYLLNDKPLQDNLRALLHGFFAR